MKINNDIIATAVAAACLAALLLLVMFAGGRQSQSVPALTNEEKALIDTSEGTMRVLTVDNEDDLAILRSRCSDFETEYIGTGQFRKLAEMMIATMTSPEQDGVGIAGPQVGLRRRVVAVQRFDKEGKPVEIYPNIRIEEYKGEMQPGREGCLSVPECRGTVMRYPEIEISYIDPESLEPVRENIKGFTAIIFQHETDHLDGILYTDKAVILKPSITPEHWIAEDASGAMQMSMTDNNTLDIIAPEGLTLWYDSPFSGEYEISYRICMPMDGCEYDRLSDLNCFWAAKDPLNPDDIEARSDERKGVFSTYNMLDLFYVGYGGNHNTTTRFRRYYGARYGQPDDSVKPLIKEYTDPAHLLVPGKWYTIEIKVSSDSTSFHVDGEKLFEAALDRTSETPEGDGHFAIRLLQNHVRLTDLQVRRN